MTDTNVIVSHLNKQLFHEEVSNKSSKRRKLGDNRHRFSMDLLMEVKSSSDGSNNSLLTVEHFKEIVRFQEWLESLEYPIVPGIPAKMPYKNPPKTISWYDMC